MFVDCDVIFSNFLIVTEDEVGDTASEMASTMSEKTGYSVSTDKSTTLSVQDALNSNLILLFVYY